MKHIKELWGWVKKHPVKAVVFLAVTLGPAAWWELNGEPNLPAFAFFEAGMLLCIWSVLRFDLKKSAVVILCAALLCPSRLPANEVPTPGHLTVLAPTEEWYPGLYPGHPTDTASVAVGVCIIAGGIVGTIYLIKWCKKLYSKTNSEPEELIFALNLGEDESASSDFWFADYCIDEPVNDFTGAHGLEGGTLIDGNASISDTLFGPVVKTSIAIRRPEQTCTRDEFMAYVRSKGLPIDFGRHYARNGVPALEEDAPIRFATERGLVPHVFMHPGHPDTITTVTERTFDLVEWTPLVTNTAPKHMQVTFSDRTDSGHAIYRTLVVQ